MYKFLKIWFVLFLVSVVSSCSVTDETKSVDITGEVTSFTTCKSFKNYYSTDSVSLNQSCVDYTYLNGVLFLTHINAGFNCCPGFISADFNIDNSTITISEFEEDALCDCDCLYDLEIEITGLEKDTYTIIFDEPYCDPFLGGLSFSVNLNDSVAGSYCITRTYYPWGF